MSRSWSEWWRGAVIYQVYPRSFCDSNDDGIGDLPGVVSRLDYIESLGVDAVWLSPFYRSPMRDFGYDIADHRAVDPSFGTLDDVDALIAGIHDRGMRIIIDAVLAHTSNEHAWFVDSRASRDNPRADWYVWADAREDGGPPNNWLSVFGGPSWKWEPRRGQYYLHHFLPSQPNLNWHNADVCAAMLADVEFWLERGVDGLRLDAITTLLHDEQLRDNPPAPRTAERDAAYGGTSPYAMQAHVHDRGHPALAARLWALRALVDRYPDRFLVAEVADVDSVAMTEHLTGDGGPLHSAYTFAFAGHGLGAQAMHRIIDRFQTGVTEGWPTFCFSNHDCERAVSRWAAAPELRGDDARLAVLLMACLLSLRGSAIVYQGLELGLPQASLTLEQLRDPWGIELYPVFCGRDGARTPMPWRGDAPNAGFSATTPWLPVPPEHRVRAVDRQSSDPDSVLAAYRRFIAWRRTQPALVRGRLDSLELDGAVYRFERTCGDERVLCAFNMSNRAQRTGVDKGWQLSTGHGFDARVDGGVLILPPFGAAFAVPTRAE